MLQCSLGRIDGIIVRRALSGYTFVETIVPVDTYTDTPTFTAAINGVSAEYKITGSEVFMNPGEKTTVKITALRADMEKWMDIAPVSYDSVETATALNGLGVSGGSKIPVTLLNLFLNKGQLALVLANLSAKMAFVDFENGRVLYYSELYKQKPMQLAASFRRIYGRAPIAGFVGWGSDVNGMFPYDTQSVLPFGQFNNVDRTTMENLLNNCNGISKLFSDMQIFSWPSELPLGATVLSPLTSDKKVIVAIEQQWDMADNISAVYYCV